MKTLCITGTAHPAFQAIAEHIFFSGLAPARAPQRSGDMDIATWHRRVLAQYPDGVPTSNLGRLWEQLATDIFMDNMDSPVWGWSDPHSIELLEFWQQFDPHIYFVLVCVSPQQAIAHAIASPIENVTLADHLQKWHTDHRAMLRFHLRYPERSALISAEATFVQGSELIATLSSQWGLPLQSGRVTQETSAFDLSIDPMADYLAQQLITSTLSDHGLHQEILASLTHLAESTKPVEAIATEDIITAYRHLRARGELADNLEQQRLEQDANRDALKEQIHMLTTARDQQAQQASEHQKKIDKLAKEKNTLSSDLNSAKQESKLLLRQLHQVQEELENLFLKEQHSTKQVDLLTIEVTKLSTENKILNKQIAEATAACDKQTHSIKEYTARIDTLGREKSGLTNERDATKKECDALKKQLEVLNIKHDKQTQLVKDHAVKIEALNREKSVLTNEREAATKERDSLKKQVEELNMAWAKQAQLVKNQTERIDSLTTEKKSINANLNEIKQEGELLLAQLRQVQEELEHYFLEYQKLQRTLQAQDARWQRMVQRNPAYCDYTHLKVAPTADATSLTWTFTELETAGRHIPQLICQTRVVEGDAAMIIQRTPTDQPLLRWPAQSDDMEILLTPGTEATRKTLTRLATSDLILIQNLTEAFELALSNPDDLQLSPEVPTATLRTTVQRFKQQLIMMPPSLRYDGLRLKHIQTNPDYEHLWLVLDNLSLGTQRWPEFEFRLACANVGPQRFGDHPKLEFPRHTGSTPLLSWFEDTHDDHGPKLELRFALPDALDMQTWARLDIADQHFLSALCVALPDLLHTLQADGASISRAWSDWRSLAENIQRILALWVPDARQLLNVA